MNELQQRCKLIQGSFHNSKIPAKPANWRARLFKRKAPKSWRPQVGDKVFLRPGTTIGAAVPDRAEVFRVLDGAVDVRIPQLGAKWKTRILPLQDVRPIE